MIKLNALTAVEMARRLERREITAEALLRDCLERIAEREAAVQAWTFFAAEPAIAQARALDRGPMRGRLHGLPVGVKDIFDTYDMPTEYGSPIYRGHRPAADAACVALTRRAGGVILGKTVTTEFATFPPGKTRNPHDPRHTPGGSSSGSAAGVADFMMPLAFGTQTAGSVIRPAAYCGVVGYKPTYHVLPRGGVKLGSDTLDTVGVIGRTVADVGLFVAALTRRTDLRLDGPAAAAPPRVGICRTHEWDRALPETVAAMENAAAALSKSGARVAETPLPSSFSGLLAAQMTVMSYEGAGNRSDELNRHADQLHPKLRESCEAGFAVPIADYVAALALAEQCRAKLKDVFGECDVFLAPSAPGEAPDATTTGSPVMNQVWTLLHVPCVTVPVAKGPKGLPVGLQVVGRLHDDARTLAAAAWIHERLMGAK
jgi:Asp-tRNA(Asn)/Glu-tRNA(Gln) amidotransferase A subunit family amidase